MTYFLPEILSGHIYHVKASGSSETVFVTLRAAGGGDTQLSGGWRDWLALSLAVAFTAGCVLIGWYQSGDDLEAAQHELVLDELWLDGDDWLEAA